MRCGRVWWGYYYLVVVSRRGRPGETRVNKKVWMGELEPDKFHERDMGPWMSFFLTASLPIPPSSSSLLWICHAFNALNLSNLWSRVSKETYLKKGLRSGCRVGVVDKGPRCNCPICPERSRRQVHACIASCRVNAMTVIVVTRENFVPRSIQTKTKESSSSSSSIAIFKLQPSPLFELGQMPCRPSPSG